jgi:prepilin-type N-terminal cleavage/methylation domain-containing protein
MTLVELMAVVAIIGVVAVLAAAGYGKWTKSAKMTEATDMVAAIKTAQENYYSQTNKYLDVSTGLSPGQMHPRADPKGASRGQWNVPCTTCNTVSDWRRLGVTASAPLIFSYASRAGTDACDPDCAGLSFSRSKSGAVNWKALNGGAAFDKPWYVVTAATDVDSDGKYATVIGASFNSQLVTEEE